MDQPGTPTWLPRDEEQLRLAAERGHLEEGHHLEIKGELHSGRAANKELARDLASFAITGGLILYGVAETPSGPTLTPLTLAGEAERIDQVARTAITPSLYVRTHVIPSAANPEQGYIAVTVPASGQAPHMTSERYWGRSDKTKYPLPDAEVRALHSAHHARADQFNKRLTGAMEEAPAKGIIGTYVAVAAPVAAHRPLLKERNSQPHALDRARQSLASAADVRYLGHSPNPAHAKEPERRPRGIAVTGNMKPGRAEPDNRSVISLNQMVEVVFHDDGTITVFTGRATVTPSDGSGEKQISEELIVGNTAHLVALAAHTAQEADFGGSWQLGVGLQGLRGGVSGDLQPTHRLRSHPYTEPDYVEITTATREELERAPDLVTGRLTLTLLRALGSDRLPQYNALHDTASAETV